MTREKVIKTKSEYEQAIDHLSKLMDAAAEIDAEIELISGVIEEYERRALAEVKP
mgnify:CR=1 FL=1